ncbi:MAG: hypothetical protein CM15mP102_13690 [Flavobacteriales bacterium]|nr:MAG: hypothetical protein CM15mP102_13690 [Flavobacteriales bacterium]
MNAVIQDIQVSSCFRKNLTLDFLQLFEGKEVK